MSDIFISQICIYLKQHPHATQKLSLRGFHCRWPLIIHNVIPAFCRIRRMSDAWLFITHTSHWMKKKKKRTGRNKYTCPYIQKKLEQEKTKNKREKKEMKWKRGNKKIAIKKKKKKKWKKMKRKKKTRLEKWKWFYLSTWETYVCVCVLTWTLSILTQCSLI